MFSGPLAWGNWSTSTCCHSSENFSFLNARPNYQAVGLSRPFSQTQAWAGDPPQEVVALFNGCGVGSLGDHKLFVLPDKYWRVRVDQKNGKPLPIRYMGGEGMGCISVGDAVMRLGFPLRCPRKSLVGRFAKGIRSKMGGIGLGRRRAHRNARDE
jgi:hypothetical protein